MTPKEVLAQCRANNIKAIDLKFMDFIGSWAHTTIPTSVLDEACFEQGLGFDGSSLRGWQRIDESDMLLLPQPETTFVDPFTRLPTLNVICNIADPITHENYSRDPRFVARKAESYLNQTGIADRVCFGPEAEFFIFDDVRFDQRPEAGFFFIDSNEAQWNRGRVESPNLGEKIRHQEGYLKCPPVDQLMDIRNEMMQTMIDCGLMVECQHHEVGSAGQSEIDLQYDSLVKMADKLMMYKYIVKNVAFKNNKTATFMPKPIFGDAGSGMHTHFSLWKQEQPLFAGDGYAGLSQLAMFAMGGILQHAPALWR